jgi:hypothetical protein
MAEGCNVWRKRVGKKFGVGLETFQSRGCPREERVCVLGCCGFFRVCCFWAGIFSEVLSDFVF